jgi:16S rRNA (cytidine1402-2'-O)-methyltransferase
MSPSLPNSHEKSKASACGVLYLVATPIGNRGDITQRALECLRHADVIACEDTRVSKPLMAHYSIATPCIAYHAHNERKASEQLIHALQSGKNVALISDAGSPLISDPGAVLVQEARRAGMTVTPIPGASAIIAALSASGLCDGPFYFAGFLPRETKPRDMAIRQLQALTCSCVLYEAPHRLAKTLAVLAACMPTRKACIARELTKRYESYYHGSLAELAASIAADPVKGECVLVLSAHHSEEDVTDIAETMLRDALTRLPATKAAAEVAAATGLPRKELYSRALTLKDHGDKS